ncbi:hypothetical protein OG974_31280 (plasmid) [Streptomyces sp. NBC_00597]|nr:hypothetical protein [Streptomyces sp. NBC_01278]
MFVAGDHEDARQQVAGLLKAYGWTDIFGLGLGQQFGGHFGIKVVR